MINSKMALRRILRKSILVRSFTNLSSDSPSVSFLGPNVPDVWIPTMPIAEFCRDLSPSRKSREQTAKLMDGRSLARDLNSRIAAQICALRADLGKQPVLVVVLVGERRDSHAFIDIKLKACQRVGIGYNLVELPETCVEDELIKLLSGFNSNPSVHGIIVQLPLPQHLNEERIINFISPEKDVDGLHPLNIGNLAIKGREPYFTPCASKGCLELLLKNGVEITGKRVTVIGRSKIVGLPTSLLLQRHHATVSVVHPFTKHPDQITREADIVISDVGVPNFVRGHWLKPGAIVIDSGANSVKDSSRRRGFRIAGDVCFEEAAEVAAAVSPVPGGLGPVTISMLLSNILDSAKRSLTA